MNARWTALKALELMEDEGLFIREAIDKALFGKTMDKPDRALVKRLVYGTVENRTRLDHAIDRFSKTPTAKMKLTVLMVLRMAVYQLLYMPSIHSGTVINEAVKLIKKRKMQPLAGFVNGVLRSIAKNLDAATGTEEGLDPVAAASIKYSFPMELSQLLLEAMDEDELKAFLEWTHTEAPIAIRPNTLKTTAAALEARLVSEGLGVSSGAFGGESLRISGVDKITELGSFNEGLFQVQDESSSLVCALAGIKAGDRVLDLCAAPGGKATHAAELVGPSGTVVACDISEAKLDRIKENSSRLGLPWLEPRLSDASVRQEAFVEAFDVVLADLPCSGLGIVRRKPDIKWHVDKERIESLSGLQKRMLDQAAAYVKPGGVLMFSTCTMTRQENEDNADWLLQAHEELESVPMASPAAGEAAGRIRIKPWETGTDGFFIAKFRKKANKE